MNRLFYIAFLFVLVRLVGGCSEEGLDTYESGHNSIYFGVENTDRAKPNVFVDTTIFSFGDHELTQDTVLMIQVNALGDWVNVSREFEYEVVDSLTTAIENTFYSLPEEKCVIPANFTHGYIPVHVYYSEEMRKKSMYYVVLQLKENQYFNLDLKQEYVDKVNDKYVQLTRHWVGISSRIQKPSKWYQVEKYFLEFSSDKYKLINQLCHLQKEDWDGMAFYVAEAYWVAVRKYLQENIDAGHPIMERNERTGRQQIMKVKGLTGI